MTAPFHGPLAGEKVLRSQDIKDIFGCDTTPIEREQTSGSFDSVTTLLLAQP
jgi:hypothetical protein